MKQETETIEKRSKAREESRPKKILEVMGWEILVDDRQYTTRKDNVQYYFSTLLNALMDIADMEQKDLFRANGETNLENAITMLKTANNQLVADLEAQLAKNKVVSLA